jgi:hypothetical protein
MSSLLTIFTTSAPFTGRAAVIQRNALTSWTLLPSVGEVILFGDQAGAADFAAASGIRHAPTVERNERGTPLLRSLFVQASELATTPFVCYAGADMILMDDLIAALRTAAATSERFLLTGQRFGIDDIEPIDFRPGWAARLRRQVIEAQGFASHPGLDYFVYPRTLWGEIPDTIVWGRAGWDNWPIYEARLRRAVVIDATQTVMAVHQNHDYSHHPSGRQSVYGNPEAIRNYGALGGGHNAFTPLDATHLMTEDGLTIRCRSCYPMCVCRPSSF